MHLLLNIINFPYIAIFLQEAALLLKGISGHQPSGYMFTSTKLKPSGVIPKVLSTAPVLDVKLPLVLFFS
jgi:hypothetical protein